MTPTGERALNDDEGAGDGAGRDAGDGSGDGSGNGSGDDAGGNVFLRALLIVGLLAFAAFWIWALFFASKSAVNKIDDREWTERAEAICDAVEVELARLDERASPDLEVRADLVVTSTDLLSGMLDDLEAVEPADEKGQAIVPDWIEDYRTLLEDRYRYADRLRAGENVAFTETAVRGVPITERIETFAGDNEMPSCAPPRGSVL